MSMAQATRAHERTGLRLSHLEEPDLLFGHGQPHSDPKTGIMDYGPYSVDDPARHPDRIRLGIIGSGETIGLAKDWLRRLQDQVEPVSRSKKQRAFFPGFAASSPFRSEFVIDRTCVRDLGDLDTRVVVDMVDRRRAFQSGLDLISKQIQLIAEDHRPDVILVALPQKLYDACRAVGGSRDKSGQAQLTPAERALLRMGRRQGASKQGVLFDDLYKVDAAQQLLYRSFRRALKARVMKWGVPIQIMRPRTFFDESSYATLGDKLAALKRQSVQEPATRAWNFCSAMYFKANGIPWRLAEVPQGTCFVGLSFFRHDTATSPHMHTSLGQVFTDQGDALVVRGDRFQWDVEKQGSPHLTREHAARLVHRIIDTHRSHVHTTPARLVIHKSSRYSDEERAGFLDAIRSAQVARYDLITLYSRGIRLFRAGTYPPVRGTVVEIPGGGELLYTMGYVPLLDTYPRGHVPKPLEVVERFGDSDLQTVCKEVLGLTKLNWNSSDYASTVPITLRFSRAVGDVLTELPDGDDPHPHYRFYI
jgi:hypothetical protein